MQAALAAGELQHAFDALLQGYQGVVVQYCTALLGHAADGEDVAQEVVLAIWLAFPHYQPTALLRTWVFRIARNQCGKSLRKLRSRVQIARTRLRDILTTSGPVPPCSPEELLGRQADDARSISRRL